MEDQGRRRVKRRSHGKEPAPADTHRSMSVTQVPVGHRLFRTQAAKEAAKNSFEYTPVTQVWH